MRQEVGREALALVEHVELDVAVSVEHAQMNGSSAVAQSVVDEVAQGLLEAKAVGGEDEGIAVGFERPAGLLRPPTERLAYGRKHLTGPDGVAAEGKPSVVGLREYEEVFRESHEPVRLGRRGPESLLQLGRGSRLPQREVELGLQKRERSAELMARVGDEAPLPLDRALEALEHRIQSLGQASDLVTGLARREPPSGLRARDRRRLHPHLFHWAKRGARERVAQQRRQEEREWRDDDVNVTGPGADRARQAALAHLGGGKANAVERDSEAGATWEVEVTKPDGSTVDVRLDATYEVVVVEGDSENENEDGDTD
jgi:hypothetical protein